MQHDNFEILDLESSLIGIQVHLQKSTGQGTNCRDHRVRVNVTAVKKTQNAGDPFLIRRQLCLTYFQRVPLVTVAS